MADYTKINFQDLDPGENDRSRKRFARSHLNSRDLGVTLWEYAPDYRSPNAHSHGSQEEVYVVIEGGGRMLLDGRVENLKQWDVIRVAPAVVRAFEGGPDGLKLIIVGGPKPEGGDGQSAEADWPD